MKVLSIIMLAILVWDFATAAPGQSVVVRSYNALTHSELFKSVTEVKEDKSADLMVPRPERAPLIRKADR
jgi:hypothetical protein